MFSSPCFVWAGLNNLRSLSVRKTPLVRLSTRRQKYLEDRCSDLPTAMYDVVASVQEVWSRKSSSTTGDFEWIWLPIRSLSMYTCAIVLSQTVLKLQQNIQISKFDLKRRPRTETIWLKFDGHMVLVSKQTCEKSLLPSNVLEQLQENREVNIADLAKC